MANLNLLVVESSGKQKRRPSSEQTIDFLSVKIGASAIEIKETAGNFDFSAKKLTNVLAGEASGEVLVYDQRGAALGVASLDAAGKVPVSQLPSAIMEYQGVYNASTNTPALSDFVDGNAAGDAIGNVYRVTVAGSQNFGSGLISFEIGDYVILNSSGKWEKSDTTDAVDSVNGYQGVVVLDTDDITEGTSNLYFTQQRARDSISVADSSSIDLSYSAGEISATVLPAGVDHDALQNFVANEHVDHSSVQIQTQANSGLAGGGDITASRQIVVNPSNATYVDVDVADEFLISDNSDSGALKKTTIQSIIDLTGGVPTKQLTNQEGSTINQFQVVYTVPSGGVALASASIAAIADSQLGIVAETSISDGDSGAIIVRDGEFVDGFSGLTIGAKLYVSRSVLGGFQQDLAGFVAGEIVYCIGRAISATEIVFDPEFEFEF
jgi:hypothetical protein